jgi:hypothetical protein
VSDVLFAEAERYLQIDWTKDPETEREARIRAVFLRRQIAMVAKNPFRAGVNLREQIDYRSSRLEDCTKDFQTTWKIVEDACAARRRTDKILELADLIREADAEA